MAYPDTVTNWPVDSQTLSKVSVDLPGGRRFEATMYRAGDGEPLDVVLSTTFASDGHGWRSQAGMLAIPPGALGEVVAALSSLAALSATDGGR